MGKQSARLYYQNQDCYDVYYQSYNLAKMYKGSELLWERLAPKYILADMDGGMMTSEVMKSISTFSAFRNVPRPEQSLLSYVNIYGLEYLDGFYYAVISYQYSYNGRYYNYTWLIRSENGYDWKKLLDADVNRFQVRGMGKYQGKLMFTTNEGICLMDSDLNIDYIVTNTEISQMTGIAGLYPNDFIVGGNTLLVRCYTTQATNRRYSIVVIKNGAFAGVAKDTDFSQTERVVMEKPYYDRDSGYFYMPAYVDRSGFYNIFRSKDGLSWTRFCYLQTYISKILFGNGYVYLTDGDYNVYRTKDGENIGQHSITQNSMLLQGYYCIDDYFYFTYRKTIEERFDLYKTKDLFSVIVTDDGLTSAEEVHSAVGATGIIDYACCTDENVKIYI